MNNGKLKEIANVGAQQVDDDLVIELLNILLNQNLISEQERDYAIAIVKS